MLDIIFILSSFHAGQKVTILYVIVGGICVSFLRSASFTTKMFNVTDLATLENGNHKRDTFVELT